MVRGPQDTNAFFSCVREEQKKRPPERYAQIMQANPLADRAMRRKVTAKLPAVEGINPAPVLPNIGRKPHHLDPLLHGFQNRTAELQKCLLLVYWWLAEDHEGLEWRPDGGGGGIIGAGEY